MGMKFAEMRQGNASSQSIIEGFAKKNKDEESRNSIGDNNSNEKEIAVAKNEISISKEAIGMKTKSLNKRPSILLNNDLRNAMKSIGISSESPP